MNDALRVVVAEDSALYRAVLRRVLGSLGVEVVAQATNGAEAVALVEQHRPDLLTLDINMPVMDGLQTLRALRERKLVCEVLVVSSETKQGAQATFEALSLGAVDFVTKPAEESAEGSSEILATELRRQLAAVRMRRDRLQLRKLVAPVDSARRLSIETTAKSPPTNVSPSKSEPPLVAAIGASTGGPAALPVVLSAFPSDFPAPILIVQHMPPLFTSAFAESLDRKCQIRIVEGHNGQIIQPAHAYIAPGGKHMKVKRTFDKSYRILVTDEPPENHCRPSVDTLFRSLAAEYGGRVVATIMTGMGNDGAAGMKSLKELGARTIAQDEATSTVFGMPQEVIRAGIVDSVVPLERISTAIMGHFRNNAS